MSDKKKSNFLVDFTIGGVSGAVAVNIIIFYLLNFFFQENSYCTN